MKQEAALQGLHAISGQSTRGEGFHLLSLLLERADYSFIRAMEALPPLAPELIAALPPSEQANYFFLEGMMAHRRQEHEVALHALERALPLASAQLQPAVLDALGQHYYLTRSYATALHYHHRAFVLLQHAALRESEHALLFPVTLHCGEDYRALGAYMQACDMYERALPHLHAEHEMKSAALLISRFRLLQLCALLSGGTGAKCWRGCEARRDGAWVPTSDRLRRTEQGDLPAQQRPLRGGGGPPTPGCSRA
jgi:tetratricopeptide (TPR) repeat protein